MIRWHYGLNGHEFEQTLGVSEGQGSLECCSAWGLHGQRVRHNNNSIYIYTYSFSPNPSHPACHIILSRVPCAIQKVLAGYPFKI